MSEKMGIENLKRLFICTIAMGNACGTAFEDKKITLGDIGALMAFGSASKDLALVDFTHTMPEAKDIDDDEMGELMEIVEHNFDIPEEKIEDKVKQILGLAARYYALIGETIDMVQNPEAMG